MQTMSPIRKDFLATNLRNQLSRLRSILNNNIEGEEYIDCNFTNESLKEIEVSLRRIRRICEN